MSTSQDKKSPAADELKNDLKPIDFDRLAELYGEGELHEILELFLPEARKLVDETEESVANQNRRRLQDVAHQLKGLSASVAASELADLSLKLETAAKDEDWAAAKQTHQALARTFNQVANFVQNVLTDRL